MNNQKRKKIFKNIFIGLVLVLVLIQFIRIDKTNQRSIESEDIIAIHEPSKEIENMLRVACYDCHSNETTYPWYSNVAPVSWWLQHHIEKGREELNFSVWGTYSQKKANHKLHECAEEIEEMHMPLDSYLWTHGDADLSSEQRKSLADWFESIMTEGED